MEEDTINWKQQSETLYRAGRIQELHALCEKVLSHDPTTVEVYLFIGGMFEDQSLFEMALAFYEKARCRNLQYIDAYLRSGDVLIRLKRFSDAESRFTLALARSPHDTQAWAGKRAITQLRRAPI